MSISRADQSWQIVPYEVEATFKRFRVRDEARIRAIVRHLQAHECVALIGPPFSEKSALLLDVANVFLNPSGPGSPDVLAGAARYRPLYLDLWQASSHDEATFFTSLAALIEAGLGPRGGGAEGQRSSTTHGGQRTSTGTEATLQGGTEIQAGITSAPPPGHLRSSASVPTALAFQNYLGACLDSQPDHLVLLIDHLQALPHDLVHGLLLALRAAYMERPLDAARQLAAVVTGGLNLVGLSAEATSPFNIAKPVLAAPLSTDQTLALAEATLRALGCSASDGAFERILAWGGGDRYIVPQLCGWSAELVQGYRKSRVDRRVVDRAAERLFLTEETGPGQAPIREAIRVIEEDPDTLLDVLHLLQHETLPRSRARQMVTRTGADRLQLSGAVLLAEGHYVLKNLSYREALARHFTTERVGHILRIAGRWQEAIAYLAPQLAGSQGHSALSQLLEATVQSIYASDSLARSCELLARGLSQGFGLAEVAIYRANPAEARLELIHPAPAAAPALAPTIAMHDSNSVEARTYEYGRYALRGTAGEARLVVALATGGRRLGVVTVERYIQGRDPHELPSQLPDLLHFLEHAASAIENVMVRAAYREIGQAVLDASALQPSLNRVLQVVAEALGSEAAHLYLLRPGDGQDPVRAAADGPLASGHAELAMVAGVGRLWNPEWQELARYPISSDHPAAACLLDGRLRIVPGTDQRLNRAMVARFGLHGHTWAFLPLQAAGQPLGTLELGYGDRTRLLPTPESRANLAAFANQVAIAVHNMQLLGRTDEARARRAAELERLRSSSLAVSATLDVPTALERIIRDVQSLFPGTEATIWELCPGQHQLTVLQSSLDDEEYWAARLDVPDSVTGKAVATGQVQIIPDLDALPDSARLGPGARLGLRSLVAVPLVSHDRALGALNLYRRTARPAELEPGAIELLEAFAGHAAVAIDNARLREEEIARQRLQRELEVAQAIQLSLLPTACPQVPGWQFAAAYRSARIVGGDFYDFCELPGDTRRLGVIIADVTDKGVPAAIFMAMSRTVIRTMALSGREPANALREANRLILNDSRSDVWLTAVYAVFDLDDGCVVYTNAGHNRPLCYRADSGSVGELDARGILLGAFESIELGEQRVQVAPGDVLVFYTDGITEAIGPDEAMFGEDRLAEVIAAGASGTAEEILQAIVAAVDEFRGTTEQADDITCVVVKRELR